MKQQIKNGIIFGLTAGIVFTLFGVVYAAWNDTVSNGDTVSASSWNALVGKVEDMDSEVTTLSGSINSSSMIIQSNSGYPVAMEGFPKAIRCYRLNNSNRTAVLYMNTYDSSLGYIYYNMLGSHPDSAATWFNSTTGAYVGSAGDDYRGGCEVIDIRTESSVHVSI